jgi:hypothetical protein
MPIVQVELVRGIFVPLAAAFGLLRVALGYVSAATTPFAVAI